MNWASMLVRWKLLKYLCDECYAPKNPQHDSIPPGGLTQITRDAVALYRNSIQAYRV